MKYPAIISSEFRAAMVPGSDFENSTLPEIAILGRSNVGKSSLINKLCQKIKLARTSSTPGRTQQFNFFECVLAFSAKNSFKFYLVDLPGFGFAKYPKKLQQQLSKLTIDFIRYRPGLKAVMLLNDCRRLPEADELAIQKEAFNSSRRFLLVATKVDKLTPNQQRSLIPKLAASYGLLENEIDLSAEKLNPEALLRRMGECLR